MVHKLFQSYTMSLKRLFGFIRFSRGRNIIRNSNGILYTWHRQLVGRGPNPDRERRKLNRQNILLILLTE